MANRKIVVDGQEITIKQVHDSDYISITDMARRRNEENTIVIIRAWLKRNATLRFIEVWEKMENPDFKPFQMEQIKSEMAEDANYISAKQLIERTSAIGIQSRAGRYGGTFAHRDIAFEFATWLSPEFKYYLIKEFQRLKSVEADTNQLEWNANRFLTKRNYALQTEAIKQNLLPQSTEPPEKDWITYANEADILNMALFSTTAAAWRTANPKAAKKGENIRDHASNIHLIVLSNLEAINAEFIKEGLSKDERFARLKDAAIFQLGIFYRDKVGLE